jgi:hypothetical protein
MIKLDKDLAKHRTSVMKRLAAGQYELTEDGIYLPKERAFVSGVYIHDVNGSDERVDSNLLTDEGLNHILNVAFNGATATSTWYLALYSGNVSPASSWTAANFASNATEITSTTEGYSESVRQTYVEAASTAKSITNTANKAAFTIATATSVTVWGAGLLSSSTRGGTSGVLVSAAKFSTSRVLYDTDVFNLGYTVSMTSA